MVGPPFSRRGGVARNAIKSAICCSVHLASSPSGICERWWLTNHLLSSGGNSLHAQRRKELGERLADFGLHGAGALQPLRTRGSPLRDSHGAAATSS